MQDVYKDIWLQLNQIHYKSTTEPSALRLDCKLTFSAALRYFSKHTHAKTINLRTLAKTDEVYLARHKISPRALIRNLEKTMQRNYRDSLAFQLNAVRDKAVYAVCPFSGKPVESIHSLLANINTIFYRFGSDQVFYVAIADIGSGFEKKAVYLPEHELLVTTGDIRTVEEEDLVELKARMVSSSKLCHEYLSDHDKGNRKTAVCLGFYHFAHHLWNELSGLHKLNKSRLLKTVDEFIVLREPLGDLEKIFPEIPIDRINRKSSTADVFNEILTNRYFAIRVGDRFVPSDLTARVYKVALSNCLPATRNKVSEAREKHSPLLWVGVKVGKRIWADQAVGLAKMLNSLHKEFPRLGVVFDGFSTPANRSVRSVDWQEYAEIINRENVIVNEIVMKLQDCHNRIGIFNIVGSCLFDANVWAHAIDFYVSPFGTLQHKVGWLANKRGIIHTNQSLLQENYIHYVWAAIENPMLPRYVRRSSVSDIRGVEKDLVYGSTSDLNESGAGLRAVNNRLEEGNPAFNSYTVEWGALADDVSKLIRSDNSRFKLSKPELVYGVKCMLKNTLRSLTRSFDTKL